MKIEPGFDPESGRMTLLLNNELLRRYYSNFHGMMESLKYPQDIKVSKKSETSALISFPVGKDKIRKVDDERAAIAVDRGDVEKIYLTINKFINAGIRKEYKTTEFIPLEGYDVEKLKKDIIEANKAKRKFCIVDTYENYLNGQDPNGKGPEYNQYMIDYGTDEYVDVFLQIRSGDLDGLKKTYKSKLVKTSWI